MYCTNLVPCSPGQEVFFFIMDDMAPEAAESRMARGIAPIKQQHVKAIVCKAREQKAAAGAEVEQMGEDGKLAKKLASKKKSRRAFKKVQYHNCY